MNKGRENLLETLPGFLLPREQRYVAGFQHLTRLEINPYSHCELPVIVARVSVSDRRVESREQFPGYN